MRQADRKYHQLSSSLTSFGYSQSMCTQALARLIFSVLLITSWVFCLHVQQAHAEVITDGTVGAAQNLGGPNFVIPQTLGSTQGTNLFHSFQNFNIANAESATFTGANTLQNVISRVTGGQSSSINGVLRSQIGQAAFYFINPAGVVFGANAVVDVPGDFHVSTATELRFSDGVAFSTAQPEGSALTMAAPTEFGFLTNQSSTIRVEQSTLTFTPDTTTSLSGSELVVESGQLINEGGEIRLTAVGESNNTLLIGANTNALGRLAITNSTINVNGNGAGRIAIASGSTHISNSLVFSRNTGNIPAEPLDSGIAMTASSLLLDNSIVSSSALGGGNAGNVDISAVDIDILNGTRISSSTVASGDAGTISIEAGDLTIDRLSSTNDVTGITSNAEANASGNAGIITVQARNLTIDGRSSNDDQSSELVTGIVSNANMNSSGNAGTVDVMVTNKLEIFSEGQISSSIFDGASGNAGTVNVESGSLTIDGRISALGTGIFSNANINSQGNAGGVNVEVSEALEIINEGQISSSIFAGTSGNAGAVIVRAGDVTIDRQSGNSGTGIFSNANPNSIGNAGNITVQARNLSIDGQSIDFATGIFSNARRDSSGNAGSVDVEVTEALNIFDAGQISSSIFEGTSGDAGTINVQAGNLTIDRQSGNSDTGILSAANPSSSGDAGSVNVAVTETLNIFSGAISTSTQSIGDAGNINIHAGQVVMDGRNNNSAAGILSVASFDSLGQAGNITLDVGSLFIENGLISISSLPIVDPDTLVSIKPTEIRISANDVTLVNSFVGAISFISTTSFGNVPAGSINIQASNRLFLDSFNINTATINADGGDISLSGGSTIFQDSQITTSVLGQGDGGDIALDFKNLVLDTGFIQANTAGFGSEGGDIAINVDALTASGNVLLTGGNTQLLFEAGSRNNVIQAAAPDGVSGVIDISSPELNIKGDLAGLNSDLTDFDTLVRDPCSTAGTQQSVLITGRRGGLPETVQDALVVPLNRNRLQQIMSDPDISGEDREPHQSGVLLDGGVNHSALAFAAVERGCIN